MHFRNPTLDCGPSLPLAAVSSSEAREWLGPSNAPLEGQANVGDAPDFNAVKGAAAAKASAGAGASASSSSSGGAGAQSQHHHAERAGFKWRAGNERMTTGIWLWSRAFVRRLPSGERTAVLLMDTQGLFDCDTGQMLTTSIFGLSTLMSSYVIYNLPNRIQEDYLQNLALFSEYGRRVLSEQSERQREAEAAGADEEDAIAAGTEGGEDGADGPEGGSSSSAGAGAGADSTGSGVPGARLAQLRQRQRSMKRRQAAAAAAGAAPVAPFQRIDLLVRDAYIECDPHDLGALQEETTAYLATVLGKTHNEDLRTVREHINSSFETVSCYLLPPPGDRIRKRDYDGSVAVLMPEFVTALC